ncbi:DNA mismatch repair endonuclease MutL [Haloquadratum walsbyi]|jgi:DNA mismatch repair enzyme (predicted ATPase)|uniref:DNA mismatch repair protein MutL n=1 Tax=Haloquadratum walsbyi J07HQW2 TaxID=1238425 RepID=U1MY90_9EURY|nr:DNA mismatch repair endonuclease MutL [Haloquadratum walsbyi]ERG95449.1 MAG: DNA mismatch repair enzyme (putative ATPase) [Haloquadratum walsbyi J07HQW2]
MSNQEDTEDSNNSICRLSDEMIAAVAAAEVITRPADVVVELIENALDAGADRIHISVTGDGTNQLVVRDNGQGMSKQDAILAVQRHTTSKIDTTKQASGEIMPAEQEGTIPPLETLGFRGEALASIATVGTVKIETNNGGPRGTIVKTNGPTAETVEPAGRACGTTVTVRDLFETVPARQEALASSQTEFAQISKLVSRYALLHPMTAMSLQHDGNKVLSTSGEGYTSALLGVYDREIAAQSTTIESTQTVDVESKSNTPTQTQTATIEIDGVLVHPTITRASRDALSIAIDGRPVSDETLTTAIMNGYSELLPSGRNPIAAVTISLPGSLTDHNVHPRKQVVRIQTTDLIADMLETSVNDALSTVDQRQIDALSTELDAPFEPLTDSDHTPSAAIADADVLGQFKKLYLLCSLDDTLLIVDQHAAHERITYERLSATIDDNLPTVAIDPPVLVSLTPGQHAALDHITDQLTQYGYEYTTGDGSAQKTHRTISVHSVPAPLGQPAAPMSICDAIDTLQNDDTPSAADEQDKALAEVACHQSLRAGEMLDPSAGDELLSQLGACENPYACPHGRPVVLTVDEMDLVRGFGRRNTRIN